MLNKLKKLGLATFLVAASSLSYADVIDEIPPLNPDEGRPGEIARIPDDNDFRVCTDPDNMPFSNNKQEGFEDKIAEVLAKDLGKNLSFMYAFNRFGFLRNTIKAKRCDILMGVPPDYDPVATSKPYYRTGHVFVWRKESGYDITGYDSPDLKKGLVGTTDKSPTTVALSDNGIIGNAKPYRIQRDLTKKPSEMIDDLEKGEIDVAIAWGPIGGYFAKQAKVPLMVKLAPEYEKVNARGKTYWNMSIGVRHSDKKRLAEIQGALDRNHDKIMQILADYGVPTVPVVEGDNIIKTFKENKKNKLKSGDYASKL
ncbi:MAG: quinoprotein dehydrogenase-associated putative ABC transporter substrate-binding protein [Methylophilaceae bacterium]|nr:quinoprotein dehydrogenase-associated putative ABC transporter substrate-binding protein [Methylophilaceae bacterium]